MEQNCSQLKGGLSLEVKFCRQKVLITLVLGNLRLKVIHVKSVDLLTILHLTIIQYPISSIGELSGILSV